MFTDPTGMLPIEGGEDRQERRKESGKSYWEYGETITKVGPLGIRYKRRQKIWNAGSAEHERISEVVTGRGSRWNGWQLIFLNTRAWAPGDIVYDRTYNDVLVQDDGHFEFSFRIARNMKLQVFLNDTEIYSYEYLLGSGSAEATDARKKKSGAEAPYELSVDDKNSSSFRGSELYRAKIRILVTSIDRPVTNLKYGNPMRVFNYKFKYEKIPGYWQHISRPEGFNPNKNYKGQENYRSDHDVFYPE
jgi:hypothetical protein